MNKNRRDITTIVLFGLAAILLVLGTAGSSQAALTYFSENYTAQIQIYDIGVTLTENGNDISWRNYTGSGDIWNENTGVLLEYMLDEAAGEKLVPGKAYPEALSVKNSGTIDQYVRVMVYRYWEDAQGKKTNELSPELIDLNLTGNGWVKDEDASTAERIVLYYTGILTPGETAPAFSDTITIDSSVAKKFKETRETTGSGTIVKTTYAYDGYQFVLEAETDAVQTHNAADAIKSAWGVDVSIGSGGGLSLQN
ncbi:hypothetical protein [Frisingicoccus sp.]|uniref:hypothetical protein n=1 Tax=Frisingicoccus sp. TaxID=1918627 RepID=UPI003AB703D3